MKSNLILALFMLMAVVGYGQNNPADQRAKYLTDWLDNLLELNEQQENQVEQIYKAYMNDLFVVLSDKSNDKAVIRAKKDELEKQQQALIANVLVAEQVEKYNKMITQRGKRG